MKGLNVMELLFEIAAKGGWEHVELWFRYSCDGVKTHEDMWLCHEHISPGAPPEMSEGLAKSVAKQSDDVGVMRYLITQVERVVPGHPRCSRCLGDMALQKDCFS